MEPHMNLKDLDGFSLKEYFESKNKIRPEFSEENEGWFRWAIKSLASIKIKVIRKHFWGNKSLAEIAVSLGRRTYFIKRIYERSLWKLKKRFDPCFRNLDSKEDKDF